MDNTNLNVDELLHALDNENNSSIINLTTSTKSGELRYG